MKEDYIFNLDNIPQDSQNILENFDKIIQDIRPLNSRQFTKLPTDIRTLSHELTDERGNRRMGYMNANEQLSAYVRYFMWWNLVRFTRIFANLPHDAFCLNDGDYCLDIGCGPLTVVSALWLSRPELRSKKLTFYCLDLSQSTMTLGEDIYLSIAAKTPPSSTQTEQNQSKDENISHWKIIRVKGIIGTKIHNKASFISCANMFNELSENTNNSPKETADKHIKTLLNYATEKTQIFLAEPGMPISAHFISLMREQFLQNKFTILSPCPHQKKCPMNGLHARYGGSAKWCNFSFFTDNAPKKLLALSKSAKLPKNRAVISYIFASNANSPSQKNFPIKELPDTLTVRIASDPIRLPQNKEGFYACSKLGLALVVNKSKKNLQSGQKLQIPLQNESPPRDKKSNAIMLYI